MKARKIVVSSLLSIAILASGTVLAQRPDGVGQQQGQESGRLARGTHRQGRMQEGPAFERARLALKLELTTEQREQVKAIHEAARESSQSVIEQIVLNRQSIKDLVKAEPYDAEAVQQLADVQGDLHSQLIVIRTGAKAAVYGLLTDEQKEKLDKNDAEAE